jgi:hypothetical protein
MLKTTLMMILLGAMASGCGGSQPAPEGPAEKAGKAVDEAAHDAKEGAKDAADKTGDAVEEAGDKVEEKTDNK